MCVCAISINFQTRFHKLPFTLEGQKNAHEEGARESKTMRAIRMCSCVCVCVCVRACAI